MNASQPFGGAKEPEKKEIDTEKLYAQIGQLKVENDFLKKLEENRWIERFWRTLKHKYICLNPPTNGIELYEGVRDYIKYYNEENHTTTLKKCPQEGILGQRMKTTNINLKY